MKVTIIGGGNIGTLLAAEFSVKGFDTFVYSTHVDEWNDTIDVYDNEGNFLFTSSHITATDDLCFSVEGADIVIVTYPPELFKDLSVQLEDCIAVDSILGVIPGTGGVEFAFRNLIEKGITVFGLQRVHSVARLKEYGKSVCGMGRRGYLKLSTIPHSKDDFVKSFLENSLEMPCYVLDNYLAITLTPSNPVLHTTRLYSLFKDYSEGDFYPENILFYETWDDESSELLIKCDDEVQKLCSLINLNLNEVNSLKNHYESNNAREITEKITSIPAFKGLTSPMMEISDGKWVPDFSSRYFASDFSYGLKIIIDIAKLYDYEPINLIHVWEWYKKLVQPKQYFNIDDFEFNIENFEESYLK